LEKLEKNDLSRFMANPSDIHVFHESEMQCAHCRHRQGKAAECEIYRLKSMKIMRGQAECPDFQPDGA